MTKSPPAHLFVVRHGSRLDAADKSWHLTSPTPYDPPLTYGGFLQARQVGNQIATILQQAKADEACSKKSAGPSHRRRFKIVIHSSPFLRCVQTSIGISSGLAQAFPDVISDPADLVVPRVAPQTEPQFQFKASLLRLDSFLGEWLSPEYFEMITPPPGPALMLGGAKAELLKREDYSIYAGLPEPEPPRPSSGSLWQSPVASPAAGARSPSTDGESSINVSALGSALHGRPDEKKGYVPPRPIYAVSSSGSIPQGFVTHARDASVAVDYQWDSMRSPLDFGDGGRLGEEWASMHKRFRGGVQKLVNWYASTEYAAETSPQPTSDKAPGDAFGSEEEVETVVVMVSHGAGCNALIGAITHQPVLMDIGIASITMASRKPGLNYQETLRSTPAPADPSEKTLVPVDRMYDMMLSASTEHLRRSHTTTPIPSRSISTNAIRTPNHGPRGRTSTMGGPVMSPFSYSESFLSAGSRSTSASAVLPPITRGESVPHRPLPRGPALASVGFGSAVGSSNPGNRSPPATPSGLGLWSATPSSLRLMDDGTDGADDFGSMLPDFDQKKFNPSPSLEEEKEDLVHSVETVSLCSAATDDAPKFPDFPLPTPLEQANDLPAKNVSSGPMKLHTNFGSEQKAVEEIKVTQLGVGAGGLWGVPPPPDEAERFRNLSHMKRRWTVNDRAQDAFTRL